MRRKSYILFSIFILLIVGCGSKTNVELEQPTNYVTQVEKTEIEKIARAIAKKADEDEPEQIIIKTDVDESTKQAIYIVTIKGYLRDAWSGTGKYSDMLNFSMLKENKKIWLIWGLSDDKLIWQKGFVPTNWKILTL